MEAFIQDPALLQEFLIESEELLQGVDQDLILLEAAPDNQDVLNRVFRALHTIKGTAGFLGLPPVVKLGHAAEDLLSSLRKGQIRFSQKIVDALLAARDRLGNMLADIRSGGLKEYALEPLLARLQEAQASPPSEGGNEAAGPPTIGEEKAAAAAPQEPPEKLKSQAEALPQALRVDVRKLNELVNLIGELVLERNRLLQITKGNGIRSGVSADGSQLAHAVSRLSFITEELQAAALRTRMVPIDTLFSKFPRLVRDLARSLQKDVDLDLRGQETEIDKNMVELISDPLVHLLRNALDHGLELPELRERANKPRKGRIRLEARQEGDRILISITDDGAGIDPEKVRRKAVEKCLLTADRAANLSEREVLDLIFAPGFSTAEKTTDLSGRGVGMDVVSSNIKKLNGSIEIKSEIGKGTRVHLRVPLTMAVLPVLLVQVDDETYALPLREVVETSRFNASDVHHFEGQEVVCLHGETLPLLRLNEIFSTAATATNPTGENFVVERKIVVINVGEVRVALLVDRLIGQESTVVKPVMRSFNRCDGIAGATVGGDGSVRLVLDPAGLLVTAQRALMQEGLR